MLGCGMNQYTYLSTKHGTHPRSSIVTGWL
nr:MAG TPA: hypothetical protein [Myoviridae sp. ctNPX13]